MARTTTHTTTRTAASGGPAAAGTLDTASLHRRSVEGWLATLEAVPDDAWDDPTPCRGWSVRDLVNHVVGEDLWTVPLLSGSTIEEVGDRFDGDVLGRHPKTTSRAAGREAIDATGALKSTGTVHLSYGEESADEYVRQLVADHLVHGWDLAAATGGDRTLDPVLVEAVSAWFDGRESLYRDGGAIGPRGFMTGDPRADLLARFGRDAAWSGAHAAFSDFIAAFGRGDVDAIMSLMTDDCVFEATGPAPDGVRHVGASAVRKVWESLFTETGSPAFTEEESFVAGDRGVLRWRFDWVAPDGSPGHVRGVDVVRLEGGKVSEKLSYVKG